ncbi:MAG TPA: hypothetical protein VGI39_32855 [Polyangiaceae bacterium]|jgi:hypothetical protein
MRHDDQETTDPLRAWIGTKDYRVLKQIGDAEVAVSLRRLMAEQESTFPDIDSEVLGSVVFALEGVGKRGLPAIAIAWLKEQPTHARLSVALCMLPVSWSRGEGVPPPDPALVEALLSVYDELAYDVISENTLLIVLMGASRAGLPAPLAARVRGILERAHETPDRAPGILEMIDAFLRA